VAQVAFRGTHGYCRGAVHRRRSLKGLRGEQASRPGGQGPLRPLRRGPCRRTGWCWGTRWIGSRGVSLRKVVSERWGVATRWPNPSLKRTPPTSAPLSMVVRPGLSGQAMIPGTSGGIMGLSWSPGYCRGAVHRRGSLEGLRGEQDSRPGGKPAAPATPWCLRAGGAVLGGRVSWVKGLFRPGKGSLSDGGIRAPLSNSCFQPTRLPSAVSLGLVALLSAGGAPRAALRCPAVG
jgi:hypothetical protein